MLHSFQCDDLVPYFENGQVPREFGDQVLQETLKATPRSYREAFWDMIQEDHSAKLQQITCPVLIIWGTKDALFDQSEQNRLQSYLQKSQSVELKGVENAPHGVIWTHSVDCANYLSEWVKDQNLL